MLDPKDLRIGNLVSCQPIGDTYTDRKPYYGECIYAVTGLRGGFVWLDIGHDAEQKVPCDHVQRIPLTEYWLKRAGFVPEGISGHTYSLNGSVILLQTDGRIFYLTTCSDVELHYLHQFQNLFFALTGEELNFNTEKP